MRPLTTLVLGLVALSSCGGGGSAAGHPQADACNQAAKAACTKIFGCPNLSLVQVLLAGQTGAAGVPTCETMIMANCGSTGFQCAANQTYHPDKAQQCRDQFNIQTCDAVAADIATAGLSITAALASLTMNIPPCGQICTASDGGTSTGG